MLIQKRAKVKITSVQQAWTEENFIRFPYQNFDFQRFQGAAFQRFQGAAGVGPYISHY